MNYQKHYDLLIEKAKNRCILPSEYKENHHIIPKCIGGSNITTNLVYLFPAEHLLAHLLLEKIYPKNKKILFAAFCMTTGFNKANRISCRKYDWIKKRFSILRSQSLEAQFGKEKSDLIKLKISAAGKGKNRGKRGTFEEQFGIEKANIMKKRLSAITTQQFAGKSYLELYKTKERANLEIEKRKQSIKNSNFHSNGGLKGVKNPNSKEWILISPTNEIIELGQTETLSSFCKRKKLNIGDLTGVANKKLEHSKFWLCFYKNDFNNFDMNKWQIRRQELIENYCFSKYKVQTNNSSIIFNNKKDVSSYFNLSTNAIDKLIRNPNYIPKLLKYKKIVLDNQIKITKIVELIS